MDMDSPAGAGRLDAVGARPVALITGASSGIGAALAHVFAQNGHEVVLAARRAPQLAEIAARIRVAGSRAPHIIPVDLSRGNAAEFVAQELAARNLEPAYLINNAGYGLLGPAAKLDRHDQLAMIDLNCRTLTDLSLRFIASLARHRGGILNVASISGFIPGPGMSVYNASKAYVISFSVGLRRELKPKGIRVTALCPGPVPTEFQEVAGTSGKNPMPKAFHIDAAQCAAEAVAAMRAGEARCIPGAAVRAAMLSVESLPKVALRQIAKRMAKRARRG